MKKKLSLLLAGVMTMTMLPMNLFASSDNSLTKLSMTGVPEGTVFYGGTAPSKGATDHGDMVYRVDGGYLVIETNDTLEADDTIELDLVNAEWFFRNSSPATNATMPAATASVLGVTATNYVPYDVRGWGDVNSADVPSNDVTYETAKGNWYYAGYASGDQPQNETAVADLLGNEGVYIANSVMADTTAPYAFAAGDEVGYSLFVSAFNPSKAIVRFDKNKFFAQAGSVTEAPASTVAKADAATAALVVGATPASVLAAVTAAAPAAAIITAATTASTAAGATPATVKTAVDNAVATETAAAQAAMSALTAAGIVKDVKIMIPLAAITTAEDADIKVTVTPSLGSGLTGGTHIFGYGVGGATSASAKSIVTGRKTLSLDDVIVQETRPSSIKSSSTFELIAPDGYTFDFDNNGKFDYDGDGDQDANAYVQNSTGTPTISMKVLSGAGTTASPYVYDDQVVVVNTAGYTRTTTLRGAIYVAGLKLVPDDADDFWGEVKLSVRNVNAGVTDMTFKVADRLDYAMTLTVKEGTVPTLISGRHEVTDKTKSLRVIWQENAINSWWGPRLTTFSLPDGVKFQQIDVKTITNTNIPTGVVKQGITTANADSTTALPSGTKRYATIQVDGSDIIFEDVAIKSGSKAKLEFDAWLSVRADFEGDITLTPKGDYSYDNSPIVIAKAVTPITVEAKVTDIKIGYQYQTTSDIVIKENMAGALLKGKMVNVSVTDMFNNDDVLISPNVKVTTTNGNLKTTGAKSASTGNFLSGIGTPLNYITFEVDRASTTASEITMSNVAVKINRSVPETNDRPYKVFVWGSAVAQNFGTAASTGISPFAGFKDVNDTINSAGVRADYLKVVSSANDKTSVLTQPVRVTIGANSYTVGGIETDMPAAAYISTKSNSTMVPLRFVANAFGLTDEQIPWSQSTKTATLIHPTRTVQFVADSDKMTINGASVDMVTNGTKVFAEFNTQGDGRMYVPFRALGTAFGINVEWDAETSTAIYNPTAAK